MIRFGPAGWEYPDWAGIVYPRPEPRGFDRLAYLARWFATVEISSMLESMVEGRRVEAPPGVAGRYRDVLAPFLAGEGAPASPR